MAEMVGKKLGVYDIIEEAGRGGMGTVYRAYHPSTDRHVAVKVLSQEVAKDDAFRRRFEREAKVVAGLQHIHILPVFDYGQQGDIAYLVMPFLSGKTLGDKIKEESPDLKEIQRLFRQLASALDYAHARGIMHRDIKPENVMLDDSDNALLADFGLTRMLDDSNISRLTAEDTVIGTPAYMSPEQGQGRTLDKRSDLYSLSVLLYEMLVGDVPYRAETPVAVIFKHIQEPLPSIKQKRPDLPDAVDAMMKKALAKRPEDRFDSATAIADALEEALAGKPQDDSEIHTIVGQKPKSDGELNTEQAMEAFKAIVADQDHTIVDAKPKRKRGRNRVFAIAGLVTALLGSSFALLTLVDQNTVETAPLLEIEAHTDAVNGLSFSPDGTRLLSGGSDNVARMWDLETGESMFDVESHEGDVNAVTFRPGGEEFQTGGAEGNQFLWDTDTGDQILMNMQGSTINSMAYSASGTYEAYSSGRTLLIASTTPLPDSELAGTMPSLYYYLQNIAADTITSVSFSPDESLLAVGDRSGAVKIFKVSTGRVSQTLQETGPPITDVVYGQTLNWLAASDEEGKIRVWNAGTQTIEHVLSEGGTDAVYAIDIHPKGLFLAAGGEDAVIRIWDLQSGTIYDQVSWHGAAIQAVAFSLDGTRLATGDENGVALVWDTLDLPTEAQ